MRDAFAKLDVIGRQQAKGGGACFMDRGEERQGQEIRQRHRGNRGDRGHAMSGDVIFEPELQRCICVDTRYVLLMLDKFGGPGYLLDEMNIVK